MLTQGLRGKVSTREEAANTSLYACNKYAEDIKLAKFQNCVQLEGLDYLPFVFESFGGLSMDTESFISKLATSISHRFGDSRHVVLANIFQNVACILNKSIAHSISSIFPDFLFMLFKFYKIKIIITK